MHSYVYKNKSSVTGALIKVQRWFQPLHQKTPNCLSKQSGPAARLAASWSLLPAPELRAIFYTRRLSKMTVERRLRQKKDEEVGEEEEERGAKGGGRESEQLGQQGKKREGVRKG